MKATCPRCKKRYHIQPGYNQAITCMACRQNPLWVCECEHPWFDGWECLRCRRKPLAELHRSLQSAGWTATGGKWRLAPRITT